MKVTSNRVKFTDTLKNIFRYKKSGYLRYFHNIVGNKLYFSFAASVCMTLLDSIGIGFVLALLQSIFIPVESTENSILDKLHDALGYLGFDKTGNTTLLFISLAMFVFKGCMSYIQMFLQASINSKILSETRREIVKNISELKFLKFISTDLGTIQNISTTEISRLNNALINYINTIQFVIMSACYIIIAFCSNLVFALLVMFFAGILLYFYNFIIVYFKKLSAEISIKGNKYNSYLFQLLNNYKYLKTTNSIANYKSRIITEINEQETISLKFAKINALTISAREPVILLIVGLVIITYYQISNEISTMIIFSLFLFYRTLNYILLAQSNWQNFHQFAGSMNNIIHTQNNLQRSVEIESTNMYPGLSNEILLQNAEVKIEEKTILSGINLSILRNSTTALIGKSGAGKSTLASVISGLIPLSRGKMTIDGQSLEHFNVGSYRSSIGYVSQDAVIFNDSIYNNVTLWCDKNKDNEEKFRRITKLSQLDDLIFNYKEREDTLLGDNGIILSGGQKQRISIARELFKNTEIIILDEATSSLDTSTENLIKENINSLSGKTTMIIIAHRLSTIKGADNIVLLDDGRIIASGNYDELMLDSELFRDMIKLQNTGHGFV